MPKKFNILLEYLLPYTYLIIYPHFMGSGIQTTVKANELCSIMVVYRHGVQNRIIAYMLQIGETTIQRIFVVWVFSIFSCLNLKPNDGILLDSMPEVFNKTGHGLINIKIS